MTAIPRHSTTSVNPPPRRGRGAGEGRTPAKQPCLVDEPHLEPPQRRARRCARNLRPRIERTSANPHSHSVNSPLPDVGEGLGVREERPPNQAVPRSMNLTWDTRRSEARPEGRARPANANATHPPQSRRHPQTRSVIPSPDVGEGLGVQPAEPQRPFRTLTPGRTVAASAKATSAPQPPGHT